MSFAAPLFLLGLLLIPVALLARMAARRRARRHAVRFTAVPSMRLAAAAARNPLRHLPAALLLAAVAALVVAMAKPQRVVAVPLERASIMLVSDHSRSMLATDVKPNRLRAAQRAAVTFLGQVPDPVRVGFVGFSTVPDAVRAPTQDREEIRAAINDQAADGATATGEALQTALDTLARDRREGRRPPAAIVLLSDGKTTTGPDPVGVASRARSLRIPIFTISLGTRSATVPNPAFGPPLAATPDPETLRQIARASGGRAFTAEDNEELASIYRQLGSQLGTRNERREASVPFAIAGAVLLLGAVAASVRRGARLP